MKKVITLFLLTFLIAGMIQAQEKVTLNLKDLDSGIEKYIKKNFAGYKAVEAFKHSAFFEMKTQKGDAVDWLLFDQKGKFLKKETEADKAKKPLQIRTTIAVKDVDSDITKYIKKSEYKLTEAYSYEEAFEVKILKGNDAQTLLFDKDGKFQMKVAAAVPAAPAKKADSVPAKKEEPKKADTAKKK